MSDFYTVLRRSLDRADAPDEEQRQEIYDRLRTVIVRKLDAHRPHLRDTEFRTRLVAFDAAVVRIEDEIAASFAAADDVFDELPYEAAPAVRPEEPGAEGAYADGTLDAAGDGELPLDEKALPFDDEEEQHAEWDAPEEDAEPETVAYAAEPGEYAPGDYEPEEYEEPEAEPERLPEPAPPARTDEDDVAAAGPSTMWGSAIDLAWDESTAQWHDPEEPVRPVAPPVTIAPEIHPRPDSEWDRRLQMALVEETVRSRGSAAAPEWSGAEDEPEPDEGTFFEEGQWDRDGVPPAEEADDPVPGRSGGRFGAVTSKLRSLSPVRLLGRARAGRPAREAQVEERVAAPRHDGARIEPGFGTDMVDAAPVAERGTSVRTVALADREEVLAEAPARALRALRDDAEAPPERSARRPSRPDASAPQARLSARGQDSSGIRPVRPTPAPAPTHAEGRPARTPPPPRRLPPTEAPDAEPLAEFADQDARRPRTAARRAPPPPPVETLPARAPPQRRLPAPEAGSGEQRSLAPAGNRAMRYLGSDLDDPPVVASVARESADFEEATREQRRRPPPAPTPTRNAPPEGRRLVYEKSYGSRIFTIAVVGAIVIVLAVCAYLFVPGLLGLGGSTDGAGNNGEAGIVLFGGTDPMVFQTGPDDPVNFEGDTAGGLVRVVSSTAGTARATIGPGIADRVDGREVRIQIDVRSTPGRPASTLRLAYLRGGTLLEWRTVNVTGDFAIVDAIWTVPTGIASSNGDALLIAPGVPGDGTAVDIRRITMDIGG
jgi:hypothetical protein